MRESELQKTIKEYLKTHPLVAWCKVNTTGTFKGAGGKLLKIGLKGESDIIGQLKDGRFLAIEVKLEGEKPSKAQQEFLQMVADNNGVAGWTTSVTGADQIITRCANTNGE